MLETVSTTIAVDNQSSFIPSLPLKPRLISGLSLTPDHGMFGDPLGALKSSLMEDLKPSEETLKLLELVLDHIRANLANIRKTWGPESIQYKSATEIMDQYLEENAKRLKVQKPNLEDLMQNMKLDDERAEPAT